MFQVGDQVLYDGLPCTVERVYDNDVYFVGAKDWWADFICGFELAKAEPDDSI